MNKKNLAKLLVLLGIVAGSLFLALQSRQPEPPRVGDAAPDFSLPGLAQQTVSLRDYPHSVVVLNFWATWCPPCIEEMPSLKRFSDQMRAYGVAVIGVSVDRDERALAKFAAEAGLSFPIARDPEQTVAGRYGTFKFPETYVIDSDGRIAEKFIGAVDWQDPRVIAFVKNLAGGASRSAR